MDNISSPAYMRIRQYVLDVMRTHCSHLRDTPIPSERELCKTFGVSRPTVRQALKDLIEDDFLIIRHGKGTFINFKKMQAHFSSSNILTIGILIGDGKHAWHTPFFGDIMTGAFRHIMQQGNNVRMINLIGKGNQAVEDILCMNLDGIIWVSPPDNMLDIINGLYSHGIPTTVASRSYECDAIAFINIDYEYEGYISAKHFIEKGHSNIFFIHLEKLASCIKRLKGFRKAFAEEKLKFNENFVLKANNDTIFNFQKIVDLNLNNVTAIHVATHHMYNVLEVLKNLQKDRDYMIIAREFLMRQMQDVNCLKILEPLEQVGVLAAEKLLDKIHDRVSGENNICLKPQIIN